MPKSAKTRARMAPAEAIIVRTIRDEVNQQVRAERERLATMIERVFCCQDRTLVNAIRRGHV